MFYPKINGSFYDLFRKLLLIMNVCINLASKPSNRQNSILNSIDNNENLM